ncbi:MAG: S8 family peptidase [Bacteroidota bacterium]|nr:S8 family peptidase [Bacteroidota bacterium]
MNLKIITSPLVFSLLFVTLSGWNTYNENTITNFYYYKDQPHYLNLKLDKIFFKLNHPVSKDEFKNLFGPYANLLLVSDFEENEKRQIVNVNQFMSEPDVQIMLDNLKSSNLFQYASPVYSMPEGEGNPNTLIGVEDEIIVQFKPHLTEKQINSFIKNKNLSFVQELDLSGGKSFIFKVPINTFSIDVANEVYASGFVNYSEPNFFCTNTAHYMPNDPYFPNQWALRNLGNNIPGGVMGIPGCDMRLDSAWDFSLGESHVKIAFVDSGIDTLHEDLAANMVPNSQYDFFNNDPYAIDEFGHGTCCAGIAAAVGNNSLGISGVAPNCKMIAIKSTNAFGGGNTAAYTNGLIYARQIGSWVSSNSWGTTVSSSIDNAILDGVTMGRNGKGMIFCFSSGNGNTSTLAYPASNPNVISIGGISPCNQRKSPTSCDGETDWLGSNYGTGLDVVAPGVKIFTTSKTGAILFGDSSYTGGFGRTSSACANVAGVCALILSEDSTLSWDSVRSILNHTADKVGTYSYTSPGPLPNLGNTWNNEMGYGKVNAYNALYYVDVVLPVELASFTSIVNRRDVTLNWTTASERNNSGFDIERSIVNPQVSGWSKVGFVQGNGTTSSQNSYSFVDRGLNSGKYNYRLKQVDFNGNFEYFNLSNEVGIGIPTTFDLTQNYPNPFNPSTKINYDIPFDGKVSLKLFDISGKEVATLVNKFQTTGYYTITFNGANLSSGIYFYKFQTDGFSETKRMTLIK